MALSVFVRVDDWTGQSFHNIENIPKRVGEEGMEDLKGYYYYYY